MLVQAYPGMSIMAIAATALHGGLAVRRAAAHAVTLHRCWSSSTSGRWAGDGESNVFEVFSPATGEKLADVPEHSAEEVAAKFEQAREGAKAWAAVPLKERQAALYRFTDLLKKEEEELAETLTLEMGKPISQALGEIRATAPRVKYLADIATEVVADRMALSSGKLNEKVVYEPLGVVGNISAWNYPYFISANVFAAALVTGNSVLYKPSEHAALSGLRIARLLHDAGVPKDVFVPVLGRGPTGAALSSLPGLGAICFTGSNKTGVAVRRAAAANMVKVQLELGGKDPAYVRPDVPDIDWAAASLADGAFYNCGQSCCSVERIYVHNDIYVPFVAALAKKVTAFKVGDPMNPSTYIGPLARELQISFLQGQVREALAKGAEAVVGSDFLEMPAGAQASGYYFNPVVLTNVDHTMSIMRDESFGPVIGIQAVSDDAEAVKLMNDTHFGLTAAVYSSDQGAAEAILREVDVGTAYWNCCDRVSPRLPWSGRRQSGLGSTLGLEGLRMFVQPKSFHLQTP